MNRDEMKQANFGRCPGIYLQHKNMVKLKNKCQCERASVENAGEGGINKRGQKTCE
jgi:hypothetical protein